MKRTWNDHVIRGIVYLLIAVPIVTFGLAAIGSIAFGVIGILVGLFAACVLLLWGWNGYLKAWTR